MERIQNRIGFANGLFVSSCGRGGGLALIWTREMTWKLKALVIITLMQ